MLTFDIGEEQKVDTKQEAGKERERRRKIEKMRMNAKGFDDDYYLA